MKKILATALVLGLVLPTASHAATTATATKKPVVKTAAGAEGTAKHETAEAATGTAEKTTKVAKKATKVAKTATKKKAKK